MAKQVEIPGSNHTEVNLETQHQIPYPLENLEAVFKAQLVSAGLDPEIVNTLIFRESPTDKDGDYGIHCGQLAKVLKKAPHLIASELATKLKVDPDGLITGYIAIGPYINMAIDYAKFGAMVLDKVTELKNNYGKENIGQGKRIIIDMSSPNIAKRMSIGHLRSTIIGDSLARIYKHLKYDVIKDNHLGDWGTQFGHLLRAIELWGDPDAIRDNPIEELQKLYVKISDLGDPQHESYAHLDQAEAEKQAEKIKDEGRAWFKKLEDGDPQARELWQQVVEWSMLEFQKMYDVLGVTFDWSRGESYYEPHLKDAIQKVKDSGIATESEGALVVNMEDSGLRTAVIQKSDGATLYLTREIATGIHRAETEKADGLIYVVGEDQKLYFQQFFEILKRMGLPMSKNCQHVYFGLIHTEEGKMSTRKGRTILLQDVIAESFIRTREIVEKSGHITLELEKERLIRQVSIGALKWNDLIADPKRSIVFDWDSMLSMDGKSAPYVQYSYVRAYSLLEKVDPAILLDVKVIPSEESEKELIRLIAAFPGSIQEAASTYNPSKIAVHIYTLAKAFNSFYHDLPILKEINMDKRNSRLAITAITAQTIQTGLYLLGIETPTKM